MFCKGLMFFFFFLGNNYPSIFHLCVCVCVFIVIFLADRCVKGHSNFIGFGPVTFTGSTERKKKKAGLLKTSSDSFRARASIVTNVMHWKSFILKVNKLYDVCIKQFRQEINFCTAQHLERVPPALLSVYTSTFLAAREFECEINGGGVLFFFYFNLLYIIYCPYFHQQVVNIKQRSLSSHS